MPGMNELEKRVSELESQAAFQDDLHEQLNEIVARQDQEILKLRTQVAELAKRVAQAQEAASVPASSAADEIPPHY